MRTRPNQCVSERRRTDDAAVMCDVKFMSVGNVLCVKFEIDYFLGGYAALTVTREAA
jgi:hypothetical protein